MRYAARVDGNQAAIVTAMRDAGATVYILKLPVDLLVGLNGNTALVEIKDPSSAYGRKGLNDNQQSFLSTWKGGTVAVINDIEGAMTLMRLMA